MGGNGDGAAALWARRSRAALAAPLVSAGGIAAPAGARLPPSLVRAGFFFSVTLIFAYSFQIQGPCQRSIPASS